MLDLTRLNSAAASSRMYSLHLQYTPNRNPYAEETHESFGSRQICSCSVRTVTVVSVLVSLLACGYCFWHPADFVETRCCSVIDRQRLVLVKVTIYCLRIQ